MLHFHNRKKVAFVKCSKYIQIFRMKTENLLEPTFIEHYIMSPNYPDHYPNSYEEVILKFPRFPHEA